MVPRLITGRQPVVRCPGTGRQGPTLLRATREQLESATLPPGGRPGMQRQLRSIRRELELAVSPPLVAELRRILPSHDATPSAGALRIESAVLESWVGSLVVQMLSVFARDGTYGRSRVPDNPIPLEVSGKSQGTDGL